MNHRPPIFWSWLLRIVLHSSEEQYVEGDLEETFHELIQAYGHRKAANWYRSQVIRSVPLLLFRSSIWGIVMGKNYLIIALRNLKKSLGFASINITGLAVGLACTLMIGLFAVDELSYDRHHENADQIVRLIRTSRFSGTEESSPVTAGPFGPMFTSGFPELENFFRLQKRRSGVDVEAGEKTWTEMSFYDADASILDILSIRMTSPSDGNALTLAYHLMLSEQTARRMFGGIDPTGDVVRVQGKDYVIDGVFEDFPETSHFKPDVLASFETLIQERPNQISHMGNNFFYTYFLLAPNALAQDAQAKFNGAIEATAGPEVAALIDFSLQPLTDIHLTSHYNYELEANGSVEALLVLGIIALFILTLAVVNFVNLSTARSAARAREVGVRKAVGAHRQQIVTQFLGETLLLSTFALLVSIVLVDMASPVFEQLSGRHLGLKLLYTWPVLLGLAGFTLLVGLAAGLYPAAVLSKYRPATVLKGGSVRASDSGSPLFRKGLVVFQFSVSMILIIGTLMVNNQLEYLQSRPLGFDSEQVLVTRLRTPAMKNTGRSIMDQFEQVSGVSGITASSSLLGNGAGGVLFIPEGVERGEEGLAMATLHVDTDFLSVLDVELVAGRDFSEDRLADMDDAYIINRQAAEQMGWGVADAVGKSLIWPTSLDGSTPNAREGTIVGVVEDFHFTSLHKLVEPLVIVPADGMPSYMLTKMTSSDVSSTMVELEEAWSALLPQTAFDSFFLDDHFGNLYTEEERSARMFGVFSLLAVILAGLGLLGLASYTTTRRTREIGIRKVMGATSASIVQMLASEFSILIGVAFVLSVPISYLIMDGWLSNFPYRTEQSFWVFAIAGLLTLALSLLTVGYHSLRAAFSNPISTLHHD